MKALELTKFRKVLVAKEAELSRALSRGAHHPTGEEAVTLELKSEMLEDVRDALRRLDEGTFGVCMGCGRNIKPRRLAAVPWALYCIQCQESIETYSGAAPGRHRHTMAVALPLPPDRAPLVMQHHA